MMQHLNPVLSRLITKTLICLNIWKFRALTYVPMTTYDKNVRLRSIVVSDLRFLQTHYGMVLNLPESIFRFTGHIICSNGYTCVYIVQVISRSFVENLKLSKDVIKLI